MPLVAEVLLPLPLPPFSFLVPHGSEPGPVGGRVVVPWQGTLRIGICCSVGQAPLSAGLNMRELIGWLDEEPHITPGGVKLLAELAGHSAAPEGLVLSPLLPTGLETEVKHEVLLEQPTLLSPDLPAGDWLDAADIPGELLELLRPEGLLLERVAVMPRMTRQLVAAEGAGAEPAAGTKLLQALTELRRGPAESAAALARRAGVSAGTTASLISRGWARYEEIPAPDPELRHGLKPTMRLQAATLELPEGDFNLVGGLRRQRLAELLPVLEAETAAGLSPLILAPELSVLNECLAALQDRVPLLPLHGGLNDAERDYVWRTASGVAGTVIVGGGTGLLIRTPQPGSLIVLESASTSWKQQSGARLYIPDAARRLAQLEQRRIIETETVLNAELAHLERRTVSLPPIAQRIHVSDLASASSWPLDADMSRVLRQVQERGRQAILLSSRRGFSGALTCGSCGNAIPCPNCDLPLRYHQNERVLRCHQCSHSEPVPAACPSCGAADLQPSRAAGTEWLASGVARLLPGFRVVSFDADSRDEPGSLLAGEPGVLVATTAAFRLPPLPNVSLIGVTLFDAHQAQSDFRAAEETMRLMLRLPELSLKARPLVLVQSFQPEHPVLNALRQADPGPAIDDFVQSTLMRRKAFGYPPFSQLARVEISARDRATAEREAQRLRGALLALGANESEVLGPSPAQVARVRGRFMWQLLLRCETAGRLAELLAAMPGSHNGARIRADVDPRGAGLQLD